MPRFAVLACFMACIVLAPLTGNAESKLLAVSSPNGLRYTDNDANLVAKAFGRYVGFKRSAVKTVDEEDGTKSNILYLIKNWVGRDIAQDDLVVVFLAGHGVMIDGEYYYVPQINDRPLESITSIDADTAKKLFLSGDDLTAAINAIPTKNKLLVLDTCHSGGIALGGSGVGPATRSRYSARGLVRGLSTKASHRQAASVDHRQEMDFTVIAAARSDQLASESDEFENGILTHYLVRILKDTAWSEQKVFDSRRFTDSIIAMSRQGGWNQEAVVSGGQYFSARLKLSVFWAVPTY